MCFVLQVNAASPSDMWGWGGGGGGVRISIWQAALCGAQLMTNSLQRPLPQPPHSVFLTPPYMV